MTNEEKDEVLNLLGFHRKAKGIFEKKITYIFHASEDSFLLRLERFGKENLFSIGDLKTIGNSGTEAPGNYMDAYEYGLNMCRILNEDIYENDRTKGFK